MTLKKCPYCAEKIQDDAKKCKHCGEWLKMELPGQGAELTPTEKKLKRGLIRGCLIAVLGGLLLIGLVAGYLNRSPSPKQEVEPPAASQTRVFALDIRTLAGKSVEEVEGLLGAKKPSASNPGSRHPTYLFQGEDYEISFIDGKADWITIKDPDLARVPFDYGVLELLGLTPTPPTFGNEYVMRWERYQGLSEISVFPRGGGGIRYILVIVATAEPD